MVGRKVTMPPCDTEALGRSNEVGCAWMTDSGKVMVTMNLSRVLPGARLTTSQLAPGYKQLGFKVEVTDETSAIWCAIIEPPQGQPLPRHAECQTMTKGFSVRLDVFGPMVTPAQVKPLRETVVSRLPS